MANVLGSEQEYWTFHYHEGPAYHEGVVKARDEAMAYRVMTEWCRAKGFRPSAKVRKWIVADESILGETAYIKDAVTVDAVQATTAVHAKK